MTRVLAFFKGIPTVYRHPGDEKYSSHLQIVFRNRYGHGHVGAFLGNSWGRVIQIYPRIFMRWLRYHI